VRVLFDIVHPAHVHFYRHLHEALVADGHECRVLARDKDVTLALLDDLGIPYETHGRPERGRVRQAVELGRRDLRLVRMGRAFRPDFVLARNPAGMHAARMLGAVGIFDTDDGSAGGPVLRLAAPAASIITTPECLDEDLGPKHIRYPGYKALAFLHPDHFTPDPAVRDELGVGAERFAVVRLTAMDSAHDRNQLGVPRAVVESIIGHLQQRDMRVFVSAERSAPDGWRDLAFSIAPERMLDAMAAASIVIGDSGSMVGEAAMLGTPAIFCGSFARRRTYLVDLEQTWGLTRVFEPDETDAIAGVVDEIVATPDATWRERRRRMLERCVDVSAWYHELLTDVHADGVEATLRARRERASPDS
jgi:predicted glycosyltransferase